jgi:tetratricopeptide (TPR) repeat protein
VVLLRRRKAADYCERSLCLSREGYHEEALAAANQAILIVPQHAPAHLLRGAALSDLGRHAEALDALRRALALDPTLTAARSKIALELEFLDRNAEALDAFTELLRREPDLGPLYFNRARVLRTLGRYEEALADYDQASRLRPRMVATCEETGITLALARRYDEALAAFEATAGATAGRSTVRTCVWQAAIVWHRDNPREARQLFERAGDKPMGNNPRQSANLQAVVSCALGDADGAAEFLRAQADPLDLATRVELGGLYELLSNPPMPGIAQLRDIVLGLLQTGSRNGDRVWPRVQAT